ncbi:unnamed protein product [Rotaria sp. Silwood2]|nr:unnamed protein product [Rotaria sp. Silwood2]CAF4064417.1 unnamed protein product [Rotaria sp. Silwood2]
MFAALVFILFVFVPQSIISEPNFETIPLRFDVIIERLRDFYQQYPAIVNDLVNTPFATIRPELLSTNILSSNNQSTACARDLKILITAASQRQSWALKVFDAWGKPLPSGILKGNMFWLGNYDECIKPLYQINNKSFVRQPIDTQYCALQSSPINQQQVTGFNLAIGLCLPASCTRQSIITLIHEIFTVRNLTKDNLQCSNDRANEQNGPSSGTIAFSIVLLLLALVVLIGTIIDLVVHMYIKWNKSEKLPINGYQDLSDEISNKSVSQNLADQSLQSLTKKMPIIVFMRDFSAIRTLRHIFTINRKGQENSLAFLNGIRVLSLFWVILGHSFVFSIFYTSNIIDMLSDTRNFAFQLITSAVFSVDTFFLLSGFLTALLFVRQVKKEQLSLRLIVLYYIHRYLRLTPTFILVMFVSIYLTPYFGHGPLYPVQQGFESTGCRDGHWWISFLYIGNFFKSDNMCLGVTWYLFNDMQFHWIAPLALIPFVMRKRVIGYIMTILFVLVSIGSILGLLLYYPSLVTHGLDVSSNVVSELRRLPNDVSKI